MRSTEVVVLPAVTFTTDINNILTASKQNISMAPGINGKNTTSTQNYCAPKLIQVTKQVCVSALPGLSHNAARANCQVTTRVFH